MIDREHDLSITKQAEVLRISRGSVYYLPRPVPDADLAIMRRLDRLHLEFPFAGSRMLRGLLAAPVGPKPGKYISAYNILGAKRGPGSPTSPTSGPRRAGSRGPPSLFWPGVSSLNCHGTRLCFPSLSCMDCRRRMMKSAPEISHRTKSLATAIIIGLVGIGLLVILSMSGLSGPRDTRTKTVHGQHRRQDGLRLIYHLVGGFTRAKHHA